METAEYREGERVYIRRPRLLEKRRREATIEGVREYKGRMIYAVRIGHYSARGRSYVTSTSFAYPEEILGRVEERSRG